MERKARQSNCVLDGEEKNGRAEAAEVVNGDEENYGIIWVVCLNAYVSVQYSWRG